MGLALLLTFPAFAHQFSPNRAPWWLWLGLVVGGLFAIFGLIVLARLLTGREDDRQPDDSRADRGVQRKLGKALAARLKANMPLTESEVTLISSFLDVRPDAPPAGADSPKSKEQLADRESEPMSDGDTIHIHAHDNAVAIGKADKVEIGVQPRTLRGRNASSLATSVAKFRGATVGIFVAMGDNEAFSFGHELQQLLEEAGWTVAGINQALWTGPVNGVELRFPADTDSSPGLKALGDELCSLGINAHGVTDANESTIWIGGNL